MRGIDWIFRVLAAFFFFASVNAWGEELPGGLCPFDEAKILTNFSAELLRDIDAKAITEIFRRRERWYGGCETVQVSSPHRFLFRYAKAEAYIQVQRKGEKIEQFGFSPPRYFNDSWEKLDAFLRTHWPNSAYWASDGRESHGFREGEPMAVGDGRTLMLLQSLEKRIHEGVISNKQKVQLRAADKVQEIDGLAEGAKGRSFTVARLKELLLGEWDRTAADMLMRTLGREALEKDWPASKPFLSRREFAWLMTLPEKEMLDLQRDAAVLTAARLDQPKKLPPLLQERYDHLEKIEWRASARELCGAMDRLAGLPALKDSLASRNFRKNHPELQETIYHASRDPGLAQTSVRALVRGKSRPFCFTLLLNSPAFLKEDEAEDIFTRILTLLGAGASG